MWLDSLRRLLEINQRKPVSRPRPKMVRRRRLTLQGPERLEDRMVLSTLTVSNLNDSVNFKAGDGSLRGEIAAAQSGDTIQFSSTLAGKSVNLTAGELLINKTLSLVGLTAAGAPDITINAGDGSRVFDIEGGSAGVNVTLQNLTVENGAANKGAGLFINDKAGTVTLNGLRIQSNHAAGAAGANSAANPGKNSAAQGGGVGQAGYGGGIYFSGGKAGTLVISNSALESNVASGGNGGQGGFGGLDFSGTGSGTGLGGMGGAGGAAAGGGLYVNGGSLQLSNVTIANNSVLGGQGGLGGAGGVTASNRNAGGGVGGTGGLAEGGGMYLDGVSVQFKGYRIQGNAARGGNGGSGGPGGHVEPSAPVTQVFGGSGGSAGGGGVFASGCSLQASIGTIQSNAATGGSNPLVSGSSGIIAGGVGFGGGLFVSNGSLLISSSTLADNVAKGGAATFKPGSAEGGAVSITGGQAQLLNDTLALNSSTSGSAAKSSGFGPPSAGGAVAHGLGDLRLINDTIAKNSALSGHFANGTPYGAYGGGVYTTGGTAGSLEMANTILAFNTAANSSGTGQEIGGPINSSSHDLIDNDSDLAGFTPGVGDLIGVTPSLAPLGNYGGPTQTMPLLPGSPGIDAGANSLQGPASTPGLIDWWRGQGNANDSAGLNNGTASSGGGVSYTRGTDGQAFNFNGNGSYVDLGTGPDIVGTGAFTLGVWIRTSSDGMIINQRDANNFNGEYVLQVQSGKINWYTYGNNQYAFDLTSNQAVNDGNWHFIAVTRLANGAGQIYIDGKLDSSSPAGTAAPLLGGVHVYLGEDVRDATLGGASAGNNFVGQMDEVQLYNQALSASQIQSLASPSYTATGFGVAGEWPSLLGGLVAWLPGDGNFADASGNSNPGAPIGNVGFTQGQVGQAFQLNGADYITVLNSESLSSSSSFTVGGWFQLTQAPAKGSVSILASKYDGNYHGWILDANSSLEPELTVENSSNNVNVATSSTPLALNQWYYIAASYDSGTGTATVYVNGTKAASASMTGSYESNASALLIGAAGGVSGNDILAGKVDEFAVYNRALTPFEVSLLSTPIATDQRFDARTVGPSIDIGATEYQYNLAVAGSAPATATPGGTVTYNLTVTNNGPDPVTNVTLTDTLPVGVSYESLSVPSGWTLGQLSGQTITAISAAGLAHGASATFVLTAAVNSSTTPGTVLTDTATVSPTTDDTNLGDNTLSLSTTVKTATGVDIHGQPNNALAGQPIGPVEVAVVDANGNTIVGSKPTPVTLSIYSGPKGAVLEGQTTVWSVNGVATFTNLALNEVGTYVLTATSGKLTPDFSNPFTISPANVSDDVQIQSGRLYYQRGQPGFIEQTVTITNASTAALHGPLALVLSGLPQGVTLLDSSGAYQGDPYLNVLGVKRSLAPGQKVTLSLVFLVTGLKDAHDLSYSTEALLGI
jgi:uncharacterized repeat protein (TIGR01451 family)